MKPALFSWFALIIGLTILGVVVKTFIESNHRKPKQLKNE